MADIIEKKFMFHTVLNREDICNYKKVQKDLLANALRGEKTTVFGRRNIGKTSLIQNAVIPDYRAHYRQKCIVIFIDFYGVRTLQHITERIAEALQKGFAQAFPKTALLKAAGQYLGSLRPLITTDPLTNEVGISFDTTLKSQFTLEKIFEKIAELQGHSQVFIVCDEFQDISFVEQAEGKLRRLFENIPSQIPIFILGSKQHLLVEMFAKPRAPFAAWGKPFEFPKIDAEDYLKYINERFNPYGLSVSNKVVLHLLERMEFVPESINIVCDTLTHLNDKKNHTVSIEDIEKAIAMVTERSASVYRTLVATLKPGEENVIRGIAKFQTITSVRKKEFLSSCDMSATGASKALKKLLDGGYVLQHESGYSVSDPLLREFLKRHV